MTGSDADRRFSGDPDEPLVGPTRDDEAGTGRERADPGEAQPDAASAKKRASAGPELEDRLRRALADADNTRKRCEQRVAESRSAERVRVCAAWLPIVDNLELALEHADGD